MIKVNLRNVLEKKGITITQMSNDTGIARSTLTPIVNDPDTVKSIRFNTLDKMCEYLNVDLSELIEHIPNKEEFKILDTFELDEQNDDLIIIEAKRETTYSSDLVFLSVSGQPIIVKHNGEPLESDSYKFSIEVINGEDMSKIEKDINKLKISEEDKDALIKSSSDIWEWLNNLNRESLRDITINLFSKLLDYDKYPKKTYIALVWNIGNMHFDSLKNSFTFEVDYEKRKLNDVSDYREANIDFRQNDHFM